MAALVKFTRAAGKLTNKSSLGAVVSVRNHWNKDFKPAPFPQTQKEREAAAKKYGIPIEEYQPYPDDGLGYGDYPKLKDESIELRDPYYAWDYPEHKRNFLDPLHVDHDLYSEDRWNNGKISDCSSSHTSYDDFLVIF
jgi:NADH dehydrogenase (ubiquinone) 1 beta subcomplex subunit 8